MGWSISYDKHWDRDIGYGVPATCDHPGCNEQIDRGLSYVCGGKPYGGRGGCGLYFCSKHIGGFTHKCERCQAKQEPFTPKPDVPEWINHKLTDESWAEWRAENPEWVAANTPKPASQFSGGPIKGFAGGWAKLCFIGEKPHYWQSMDDRAKTVLGSDYDPNVRYWISLCDVPGYSTDKAPAFGVGNIPLCKRCQKKAPALPQIDDTKTFVETVPGAAEALSRG